MMKAAFFSNSEKNISRVYGKGRREILGKQVELFPEVIGKTNFEKHAGALRDVEIAFSTWGVDMDLAERMCTLGNLKAVFYGAGSVQGFALPLLRKGVVVMSAWGANAVPVAEFTLSQILLSLKCYFQNIAQRKRPENWGRIPKVDAPGNFGEGVALLGCGMVGRLVVDLLRPFNLEVLVYDLYLEDAEAAKLGVTKVSLADAFARGFVVSNHLPNLEPTVGLLTGELFSSMRCNSTFINTGRGATIRESEMIEVLRRRTDICALLDVTHPEPPLHDSPLNGLGNVFLTSHIAGSLGDEVVRMADYCIEEFQAWCGGKPMKYRVTEEMLKTMA